MKKILLGLSLLAMAVTANAAGKTILIDGQEQRVDTLVHKVVGPGNTYLHIALPNLPIRVYIMKIDTHNQYNRIETYLANDRIEGTELVTGACARKSYEGHDAYCGINGDFFNVIGHNEFPLGAPRGGSIENGEVQIEPNSNWWGFATIDEAGTPILDYMSFLGTVTAANGETFNFINANNPRTDCGLTFFNRFAGETTRQDVNSSADHGLTKTEVYIKPIEGQKWGINRDVKCKVIKKVTNLGSNPIAKDESVLSGIKDAKVFLDKFNDGDVITVKMAITTTDKESPLNPNIREMIGGNAMILQNGILTERNTNDGYNNVPYPRTSVGASKDGRWLYLLVVDGKGQFRGATTGEVAQILKFYGADDAVGLDGGGSAEMIVSKKVVNWPADGRERPVGNGWLVVNTAPKDSTIAKIRTMDSRLILPIYGTAKPVVLAYNKYDALMTENLEGVTFTCDAAIGHVDETGTFIAKGEPCAGYITANYNGLTAKLPVEVKNVQNFAITHSKILVDDKRPYEIEVSTEIDNKSYPITPKVFNWTSADNSVCTVNEKGFVTGLKDGDVVVTGTLGDIKKELTVSVQIPTAANMPVNYPTFPTDWTLKQTGGTGLAISSLENGFKLDYTGNGAARGAYISVARPMVIWSLPEAIRIKVNPGESQIKKISMNAENALGERIASWVFTADALEKNKESVFELKLSDWCNPAMNATYPIQINSVRFDMGASKKGTAFSISVPAFEAIYPQFGGVAQNIINSDMAVVYPNPVNAGEAFTVEVEGKAEVNVFALNGEKVLSTIVEGTSAVSTQGLATGVYFVNVVAEDAIKTSKLIIK